MRQQILDFLDDPQATSPIELDEEQRLLVLETMRNLIIHVYQIEESTSDEPTHEN